MLGGFLAGIVHCCSADIEALIHESFTCITNAGVSESHPHDVAITS